MMFSFPVLLVNEEIELGKWNTVYSVLKEQINRVLEYVALVRACKDIFFLKWDIYHWFILQELQCNGKWKHLAQIHLYKCISTPPILLNWLLLIFLSFCLKNKTNWRTEKSWWMCAWAESNSLMVLLYTQIMCIFLSRYPYHKKRPWFCPIKLSGL